MFVLQLTEGTHLIFKWQHKFNTFWPFLAGFNFNSLFVCWMCNVHSNDCGTTCMQQCDNNVDCTLNWLNLSHSNVCFFELSAQQQNSSKLPQGDINANLATANISHLLALCSNKHLFNFYAYEFSVTSRQCRPKGDVCSSSGWSSQKMGCNTRHWPPSFYVFLQVKGGREIHQRWW